MNLLPPALRAEIERTLDLKVRQAMPLGGGMICRAARVETSGGPVFVKWKEGAPPGFFAAEADGLRRLRATNTLRVPEALAWQDSDGGAFPFLILEYLEERRPADPERFAARFGRALAEMHRQTTGAFDAFGLDVDNYLGDLRQINTPHDRWPDFYRDCRIAPQIVLARKKGLLPPERERLLQRLTERIDNLLDGLPARPVLVHGDLWSGNLLSAGDTPVVIDPAVYYGDREVEIAYMELFSGFPSGALAAYRAVFPLDPGSARRRPLHQLYPLLVHLNHFGEPYGGMVQDTCEALLRQ